MKTTLTLLTRALLIFLMCFSYIGVQGQKSKSGEKSKAIFVGINFSPDYSFRTLKDNTNDPTDDVVIKTRNDIEIARFGYTTGLNAFFNCSKYIGFETGIQYSNKGYNTKSISLVFDTPNPNLPIKYKSQYSYKYIGIPLKARFTLGEGKIRFLSTVGFMTNLLLQVKQTNVLSYSDGRTKENKQPITTSFNRIDISPMISVGIDYKISDNLHLSIEPTFRYGIIKTRDAQVSEHLWNAGINLGLQHKLK